MENVQGNPTSAKSVDFLCMGFVQSWSKTILLNLLTIVSFIHVGRVLERGVERGSKLPHK